MYLRNQSFIRNFCRDYQDPGTWVIPMSSAPQSHPSAELDRLRHWDLIGLDLSPAFTLYQQWNLLEPQLLHVFRGITLQGWQVDSKRLPGWLSPLSLWLLISAQVMISGLWGRAPHRAPSWAWSLPKILSSPGAPGWLSRWASAFGSGRGPGVLGSSPALASLLGGEPVSPLPPHLCSLSLSLSNK